MVNIQFRKTLVLLLGFILILILAGCGYQDAAVRDKGADPGYNYEQDYGRDSEPSPEPDADQPDHDTVGDEMATAAGESWELSPDRMLIFEGNILLKVDDVEGARQDIEEYVNQQGGYVSDRSFGYEYGVLQGQMIVRVPRANFIKTMNYLERRGELVDSAITSEDVTSSYVDLESELRSLRKQQEIYMDMFDEAKSIEDMLKVEERLHRVRTQIEKIVGQKRSLEDAVNYSTITVRLEKERDDYVVVFHSNTGYFDTLGDTVEVKVKEGHALTENDFPVVNKNNYRFVEWNTREDGEGREFTVGLEIKEDMDVYAIWRSIDDGVALNLTPLKRLGSDIADAFTRTLNAFISFLTGLVVFLSRIAIYLVVIALIAYALHRKRGYWRDKYNNYKLRRKGQSTLPETREDDQ